MKKMLAKCVAGIILFSLLGGVSFAQGRIATIDLRRVFDNYWKTKQADASLKDRAADMEKEHKNMIEDFKKGNEDYKAMVASADDQAVAATERDKRKKAAEDKLRYLKDQQATIEQYERQARTTLDEQRRRMRENILGEIRAIINAKSKSAGYSLVIDVAAESFNNTPVVLYTNNEQDLTQAVLDQLNATQGSSDNKGADLTAPVKASESKPDKK